MNMEKVTTQATVADAMTSQVATVFPEDSLAVLTDRMMEKDARHMPVVDPDDGTLLGLVSHRDLLRSRYIEQEGVTLRMERSVLESTAASEVMVFPVKTVGAELVLRTAAEIMLEYKFGCLPVTDGRRLIGILTESDFVRWVATHSG